MNLSRLKTARRSRGLTQAELAQSLGIDQGYLSRIERGEKTPSLEVLQKLTETLDVPLSAIVTREVREPGGDNGSGSGPQAILQDYGAPEGLRALAGDANLIAAIGITEAEWQTLRAMPLPAPASKDGYVSILFAIRAACYT